MMSDDFDEFCEIVGTEVKPKLLPMVKTTKVRTKSRKLKAKWTIETRQDLIREFYGIVKGTRRAR